MKEMDEIEKENKEKRSKEEGTEKEEGGEKIEKIIHSQNNALVGMIEEKIKPKGQVEDVDRVPEERGKAREHNGAGEYIFSIK